MRIKFTSPVDVDIANIPQRAWGRLQLRTKPTLPSFAINPGETVAATEVAIPGRHYFPVGAEVELPDDMAAGFIEDGKAAIVIGKRILFDVERPK